MSLVAKPASAGPSRYDAFSELPVLDNNPANGGSFTITEANALG